MKYFDKDFLSFFKELAENNQKEWFHANKKRYEQSVKKPFNNFVQFLISEIQKKDKEVQVEPKDCILRINRDIRFSADKTPYNTHVTAIISKVGKKDKSIPGVFIRLAPDKVTLIGGCYMPDKEQLQGIRTAIVKQDKTFRKIIQDKTFQKVFGSIQGDQMKRIPKEWQNAAEKEPYILNKQFYYMTEEKSNLITSDKLAKTIMQHYETMRPLNLFLQKAIS